MTRKEVQDVVKGLPNIKVRWEKEAGEWRVAYRGLKPEREEAMAYYSDDPEDVVDTARTMQRDYLLTVFESDKVGKEV